MGSAFDRNAAYPHPAPSAEHPIPRAVREQPAYQQVMVRLRAKVYASLAVEQRPAPPDTTDREDDAA